MSSFTNRLTITQIGPQLWQTAEAFDYYVGYENSNDKITVPKGFITDLASVPPPASMLIPKSGLYNQAAVLHDFLYNTQTRTRLASDRIFLEAMKVLGVNLFKRLIMYRAVRTFSWIPWNRHSRRIKNG